MAGFGLTPLYLEEEEEEQEPLQGDFDLDATPPDPQAARNVAALESSAPVAAPGREPRERPPFSYNAVVSRAQDSQRRSDMTRDAGRNAAAIFQPGKNIEWTKSNFVGDAEKRQAARSIDEENDPSSPSSGMTRDLIRKAMPDVVAQMGPQFERLTTKKAKEFFPFLQANLMEIRAKRMAEAKAEQLKANAETARLKEEQRLRERGEDQTRADAREQRGYSNSLTAAEIAAGRKKADAIEEDRRKATVVGFKIRGDAYPSMDDAKKLKTATTSAAKMRGHIKALTALVRAHGATPVGPVAEQMAQLQTAITIEGKNIAELGALSGPDEGLMKRLQGANPSSFWGTLAASSGMSDPVAALETMGGWTDRAVTATSDQLGYDPDTGGGQPASDETVTVRIKGTKTTKTIPATAAGKYLSDPRFERVQ